MTLPKTTAAFLLISSLFLRFTGCTETAVPQATAVSQTAPTGPPAASTAVPATKTPLPDPTEPAPTLTAVPPTAMLPPNPTPTVWQEVAKMPSARSEMSAGVIDGRIYVPGGWGNGYDQSTALEMYDPATDTWTKLADLPFHVNHHATAVCNNTLYVFGPEAAALRYNPAADTWETLTPMPEERWAGAATVLDDYIYSNC